MEVQLFVSGIKYSVYRIKIKKININFWLSGASKFFDRVVYNFEQVDKQNGSKILTG